MGPDASSRCLVGDIGVGHHADVAKYLISFPSAAMTVADAELPAVGDAARAVIAEAKSAGVYVFAGGIDEAAAPLLVHPDGTISPDLYPGSRLDGGFAIFELPLQADAVEWARRIATACRCAQEVRVFMDDAAS